MLRLGEGGRMRAGIVAIFFFVTLLALGHYVAAPFFCRSGLPVMGLDPRALCGADMHFNRAGSVLLYFSTIGIALIAGVFASFTAGRTKAASAEEKSESSHVETFEQIVAAEEMKAAANKQETETAAVTPKAEEKPEDKKLEDKKPDAIAADEKKTDAAKNEADNPDIKTPEEKKEAEKSGLPPSATLPPVAHPSALAFHAAAAPAPAGEPKAEPHAELKVEPKVELKPEAKREEPAVLSSAALSNPGEAAVAAAILPGFDAKPTVSSEPKPVTPPAESGPAASTLATAEAISIGLSVARSAPHRNFDGTNEELLERFRELKKQEGVNAIAQAQRLLDESTLSALSKGGDPKQHLSQIAHLVLAEDPDLKSGVVRGVVVHIAARLKELGIAKPNLPGTTKGAA